MIPLNEFIESIKQTQSTISYPL